MTLLLRISLAQWLLIAAAAGVVLGLIAPGIAADLQICSDLFLRLIRALIAPLLFGVLVRAIGGAGSMRELGRVGLKSLVCFEVATTLALLLGWGAALLFQPGEGLRLAAAAPPPAQAVTFKSTVLNAVPTSVIDAMARGDVLQIVVFCFLFGAACLSLGERARPMIEFADTLAEVSFRCTRFVMVLAPPAVFAAMAGTVAAGGSESLAGLAKLVATAWTAQLFFLVVVLGGSLALAGVPLARFFRYAREPFVIAFATTSSAAALPQTLANLARLGVPQRILGVVAPLSISLNLNGSTLHLGMATLCIAQAAHVPLTLSQQLMILLTLKLTSKGVAGIPRGNFVVLSALFPAFGLPMEGLALLLGIDALIDPIRTSVNIMSHCTAPVIVARWDGTRLPAEDTPTQAVG
jgi:proton glutamate symport protein